MQQVQLVYLAVFAGPQIPLQGENNSISLAAEAKNSGP